jgi:hypothetical protein
MDKLKELEPTEQLIDMRSVYKKEEREVTKRVNYFLFRSKASKSSYRKRRDNFSKPKGPTLRLSTTSLNLVSMRMSSRKSWIPPTSSYS